MLDAVLKALLFLAGGAVLVAVVVVLATIVTKTANGGATDMWTRAKPWLRRWIGLVLNGLGLALFGLVAVLEFAGTNVDWTELVGADKAKFILPAILMLNVFLRVVVTKTRGSPND